MMLIREFIEAIIIKLKLTLSLIACIVMFPHDLPQAQIYDFPLAIEQWSFPQKLIPDFWGSWKDSLMRDFTYTSSGDSILFVGQRYIMYSVRTDSGWSIPKVFFNYMSARGNGLVHPELHPDGKTLYFSSDINGRIWRSFYRNDSTWSHPVTFFDGGLNTLSGGYTLLNLIKAEAFFGFYGGTGLGSMGSFVSQYNFAVNLWEPPEAFHMGGIMRDEGWVGLPKYRLYATAPFPSPIGGNPDRVYLAIIKNDTTFKYYKLNYHRQIDSLYSLGLIRRRDEAAPTLSNDRKHMIFRANYYDTTTSFYGDYEWFELDMIIDENGDSVLSNVKDKKTFQPGGFQLYQNYPNPFNPGTVISYQLSAFSDVELKIFDVLGNEVATLVNEIKPAGEYEVEFSDVETLRATSLPSGVYFYRLKVGDFIQTKKMVLLK